MTASRLVRAGLLGASFSACLLLTVAAAASEGQDEASAWSEEDLVPGIFDLVVNGRPAGESIVMMRGEEILVPIADLKRGGIETPPGTPERHDGVDYLSLETLSHRVDQQALQLRIDAPAETLGSSVVDLSPRAPAGLRYESHPTLFADYAPRLIDAKRFEGFAEIGGSFGPFFALGNARHDPDYGLVRLMTQAVYEDRENLWRATLGDTTASTGPLGGAALLGGVSIASRFELNPYLLTMPTLGFQGQLTTPGTLDVYVNDTLVRRTPVAPGQLEVKNLAPITGEGMVRYVLRDAYGREQNIASRFYAATGVLAEGLSEYGYHLGLVRRGYGQESFGYGAPAFTGRHRYGFSRGVTGGARLELTQHRASTGLDLALAPGAGEIDVALGASVDDEEGAAFGAAGLLGYSYTNGFVSLGSALQLSSPHYATLGTPASADRDLLAQEASASIAFDRRVTVGTRIGYGLRRDSDVVGRAGMFLQNTFDHGVTLHSGYTASYAGQSRWDHTAAFSVSVVLPEHHNASISQRTGSGGSETAARVSRSIPGRSGVGYRAEAVVSERPRASGEVRMRSEKGTFGASYSYGEGVHHSILEASTGVVWMPGIGLFMTRPSDQAFAVLRVPGNEGVRGYLNNLEVGETDAAGDLFISGLLPYQGNRLRVNDADLAIDVQAESEEVLVAPPTRGGAVVTFEARQVQLTRGRIELLTAGGPTPARHGELRVETAEGSRSSLLGAGGEFELDGIAAGTWPVTVDSHEGTCRTTIVVADDERFVRDLGVLRCQLEKRP